MVNKRQFISLISEAEFQELFVSELGWNRFRGHAQLPTITIDEVDYNFKAIAERNGFQILTIRVNAIPTNTLCRKIDSKLRRQANDYIAIYQLGNTQHHLWCVPVKNNEKRELVLVEYENAQKSDLLYSKVDGFSFELGEETNIVDLRASIHSCFTLNSEKITKDFYAGFKKEHKAFAELITGIDDNIVAKDNRNKQWYTSVMLNRLMFCYFIQKKGFLNLNVNYLRDKLDWVRKEQGANRFYKSFYRGFLSYLFHDGLNTPIHTAEFERTYGKIPYLNGGMFDRHQLEVEYPDIDISDEAFIRLFKFFDTWEWHLDTRITASGKDINPDVLGYIFEQYINDRAQMGAYYTKEDITEYIGKNCIIPFLMDKAAEKSDKAFASNGFVWQTLRNSGDKYIYDAVKKGYSEDWKQLIPENIAIGIDTTIPNLLERRSAWNTKTPEMFALPTEIWRETIERLQRCENILNKIQSGEITNINDFITYNLDIRSFAYDLLHNADDHLFILHFYKALQGVTILDPTCGSGAFLFAAMNILEPLYEVCIERMQEFNTQNPLWFKAELEEISNKYRSNIQYFIFKSIILRNLYGVDIMVEATEIAKLRLFLKMVAVVEVDRRADNLGLDPLPDIDFNIRCGNTLVGYATAEELDNDLKFGGDLFANAEFREKVESEMQLVSMAYDTFKYVQLNQSEDMVAFKQAKCELKQRLASLNDTLNRRMHASTHLNYEDWLKSHQPFHWLAEFYQIIHGNGGFDVIMGNPPYVECKRSYFESIHASQAVCSSGNLYSAILYRSNQILSRNSVFGMIIPISFISTKQHSGVRMHIEENHTALYSSYDIRPAHLFEGAAQRLTIAIYLPSRTPIIYTEKQLRWHSETRNYLFHNIAYRRAFVLGDSIFRYGSDIAYSIVNKYSDAIEHHIDNSMSDFCVATTANNFIKALNVPPRYLSNDVPANPSGWRTLQINQDVYKQYICVINSSLFYWLWKCSSDGFNLTAKFIYQYANIKKDNNTYHIVENLFNTLMIEFQTHSEPHIRMQKTTGKTEIQLFRVKPLKSTIDLVDKYLSSLIHMSEEELDFIINYDIKYRMGDELNE